VTEEERQYNIAVEHLKGVLAIPVPQRGAYYGVVLKAACQAVIWHIHPRDPMVPLEVKVDKIIKLLQSNCIHCGGIGQVCNGYDREKGFLYGACRCQLKESSF
jgi:hypothetical protein